LHAESYETIKRADDLSRGRERMERASEGDDKRDIRSLKLLVMRRKGT
jgi:hypothetical protein